MTTIFDVTTNPLGYRGHYAGAFHGTEGRPLPGKAIFISRYRRHWFWPAEVKSLAFLKVFGQGGTDADGVADQIKACQANGYRVALQIRDDDPDGRDQSLAVSITTTVLEELRSRDAIPDIIGYLNEEKLNNPNLSAAAAGALQAAVADGIKHRVRRFCIGNYASWQVLPRNIMNHHDALHADLAQRVEIVGTHHYNGAASLPIEHGYKALLASMIPQAELAMSEGDITNAGFLNEDDLWNHVGAAFAVDHNLTLAQAGIYCCDYTLQNSHGGAGGEGYFRYDESAHPSGQAMLDIVAPFTKEPLLRVDRASAWDCVSAFANRAGEFVITSSMPDKLETIKKWMHMSALGTDTSHVSESDVYDWLTGVGPQPSYAPLWEPDWGALAARWAQLEADDAAASKSVLLRLPTPWKHVEVLETVYGGGNEPSVSVSGYNLTATMPRDSVVYGRVR